MPDFSMPSMNAFPRVPSIATSGASVLLSAQRSSIIHAAMGALFRSSIASIVQALHASPVVTDGIGNFFASANRAIVARYQANKRLQQSTVDRLGLNQAAVNRAYSAD